MSTYLALSLDPIHIGTGGYRLGRVDNTIVRDAGTGLPKIPGSSLAGVVRSYSSWVLDEADKKNSCSDGTCGKDSCAICTMYGFATDKRSKTGLLHFYDASILAFPVRTFAGPVWVTCPSVMKAHGYTLDTYPGNEEVLTNFSPSEPQKNEKPRINLGWLYLPYRKLDPFPKLPFGSSDSLIDHYVIAPDWLFSEIVNSNLEVRTSVCIDPTTGSAKEGALFTYEAIPAATLITFDIEIDLFRITKNYPEEKIRSILHNAFSICSTLGVGGMNTRGMGRIRILSEGK